MFSSLKTKLIVLCVTTIVAAMLTVAASNFYTTREHTSLQLEQQAGLLLKTQAKSIAEWVAAKQAAVASLQLASVDKDAQAAVKTAEKAGKFDMVFVAWPDKHAVFSQVRQRAPDYDPTARAWFKGALQAAGPFISMPYIGASSGKLLITFADLISDTKGPVAGADVLLGTVVDSVLDIRPTPQSYAFLLAADGTIIAHPDKELTLKPLGKLNAALDPNALRTLAQSGGALRSEFQGRPARLFIQTVGNTGWMLALVLDEAEATANLRSILSWSAASVVLVSILAGLLIFAFVTRLLRRVHELRDAIGAAGDGDFSQRLTASGQDELAQITEAFNRFSERITTVLHGIRGSSESVRSSSNEIASGNLDLSYRTEKQAASLAETASSVAKLTHNVKLNADSATQANILAGNASGVAERGGEVVAKVVDMMSTMNQSSKRIFDIISVIDQIAFQTNILALNAAVEAARAGEQGRGFAVVAAEVRSLAQRSATAAREIQTLITDSVERVESGTALVSEAGSTMQEIVQSVAQVTAIMSEITRASQVQAEDLEHINQAVTLMDGSTQQNAALVEEAAAAAGSLHDEASKLANSVSVFKLR